ncbi:MAG: PQQ-binding-like beta-propeller repeat protein, partial [Xanthomonadales bacterium]|nr:PQQ-binding-like beta-propeller repeat protein [Xanthomonadales bacterium]
PLGRVIALDPESGEEQWVFDPRIRRDVTYGDFANRGLSTWLDPAAEPGSACIRRLYIATAQSQLFALDARDGKPCEDFGKDGAVNLLEGLRIKPFEDQAYSMTSPPVVANGIVVVGSSIADNSRPNPASGEVRGFDARSGKLVWSWDPIPQDPGDPAFDEWRGEFAHRTGGANAWSALSADPELGIVYLPTSSPAPDYYGVLRLGQNRYANSIVALRLSTGARVWDFQTVHHDLWDYDHASPPALTAIRKDGVEIPAVLQATKSGMLFMFNRETGEPVFAVEERAVPASNIPHEEAWPTQPFTTAPPPLSPHHFDIDETWGPSEEDRASCRKAMEGLRYDGIFTPPDTRGTLQIPSSIGGAHWGGLAVDSTRQIAVVPVNRIAMKVQLIPREDFDRDTYAAEDQRLGHDYEYNMMRGTPYVMRRRMLLGPSGLPCTPPPWGSLVAVNLGTGTIRWDVPLGSMTRPAPPEAAASISEEWGSPNLGGPIATAGGVVFIGAALDRWLKAYDIESGKLLWKGTLPESGRA